MCYRSRLLSPHLHLLLALNSCIPLTLPFSSSVAQPQGTIIARGGNGLGIQGIIHNPQNICISIARVFDDLGNGAPNSEIDLSLEWCVDQGAKVVNLSLGSDRYNSNSAAMYKKLEAAGIMLIAAAGNGGAEMDFYPASYEGVMSVASVTPDMEHSEFSNYNSDVDLSAPGENILSTAPRMGLFDETDYEYTSALMTVSPQPNQVITARVMDCGTAEVPCENSQGKICIVKRTDLDFDAMAFACSYNGGVGLVVYTGANMAFTGTILDSYYGSIPIMEVNWADGRRLLKARSATMTLKVPSYAVLGGTSMSAPHVSGVAAKIWAARPKCTLDQVRQALFSTAKDLGRRGRDKFFGYGLVQAYDAYKYLEDLPSPCGLGGNTPQKSTEKSSTSNIVFVLKGNRIRRGRKAPISNDRNIYTSNGQRQGNRRAARGLGAHGNATIVDDEAVDEDEGDDNYDRTAVSGTNEGSDIE
jgi:serine protease